MGCFGNLSGKRAMVTGGSSGIGRAIALEFALAGADVMIHFAKSQGSAHAVCEEIRQMGVNSEVLGADFSQIQSKTEFVDSVFSLWGSLDIWVANAGVDLLTGPAAQLSYEEKLRQLLTIDVEAGLITARHAGQKMSQAGQGCVITIGWDQADRGMAGDSGELFATAKNAVMGFSRSLAMTLAPTVRVNCIAPGWIKTAWGEGASEVWQERVRAETPLGRWGLPEDIARLARFLASDDASYITGQVINCNGGAVR